MDQGKEDEAAEPSREMTLEEAQRSILRSLAADQADSVDALWSSLTIAGKALVILRWAAVLPAAIIAGWVAWTVSHFMWRLGEMYAGIDPAGLFGNVTSEAAASGLMGFSFVLAGAKIAPFAQRITGYLLTGLGLLLLGAMLYAALIARDYWALFSGICAVGGAGVAAVAIANGDHNLT